MSKSTATSPRGKFAQHWANIEQDVLYRYPELEPLWTKAPPDQRVCAFYRLKGTKQATIAHLVGVTKPAVGQALARLRVTVEAASKNGGITASDWIEARSTVTTMSMSGYEAKSNRLTAPAEGESTSTGRDQGKNLGRQLAMVYGGHDERPKYGLGSYILGEKGWGGYHWRKADRPAAALLKLDKRMVATGRGRLLWPMPEHAARKARRLAAAGADVFTITQRTGLGPAKVIACTWPVCLPSGTRFPRQ